ncbi:MAG: signal peptidase II [Lachnospiraceae bacterium]|nr:signal peptidase II [Lachnospiraceae bacterium]
MRKEKNYIFLWIDLTIAVLLLALDQFTKYLVTLHLKNQPALVLIDGVLELQYFENTGIAFSLFQNRKSFILITGFLVLAIVLFFLLRVPRQKKFFTVHVLMSVLVAGALGNIVDRIRFDYVVDFISFVLIHYPIFNVADCYIVVSAILLFLLFMFAYKEEDLEFLRLKKSSSAE